MMDAPNHGSNPDLERGTGAKQRRVSFTTYVVSRVTYNWVPTCGGVLVILSTGGVLIGTLSYNKPIPHEAVIAVASTFLSLFFLFYCGRQYLHIRRNRASLPTEQGVDMNSFRQQAQESVSTVTPAFRPFTRNFVGIFSANTSHSGDVNPNETRSRPMRSDTLQHPAPTPASFERVSRVVEEPGGPSQPRQQGRQLDQDGGRDRARLNDREQSLPPRLPPGVVLPTQRASTPLGPLRVRESHVTPPPPLNSDSITQPSTVVKKSGNNATTPRKRASAVSGPRPMVVCPMLRRQPENDFGTGSLNQGPSVIPQGTTTPGFPRAAPSSLSSTARSGSGQIQRKPLPKQQPWMLPKPYESHSLPNSNALEGNHHNMISNSNHHRDLTPASVPYNFDSVNTLPNPRNPQFSHWSAVPEPLKLPPRGRTMDMDHHQIHRLQAQGEEDGEQAPRANGRPPLGPGLEPGYYYIAPSTYSYAYSSYDDDVNSHPHPRSPSPSRPALSSTPTPTATTTPYRQAHDTATRTTNNGHRNNKALSYISQLRNNTNNNGESSSDEAIITPAQIHKHPETVLAGEQEKGTDTGKGKGSANGKWEKNGEEKVKGTERRSSYIPYRPSIERPI